MAKRSLLDVVYTDGTEATLALRPVGLIAAERRYGGGGKEMPRLEATLYAAWFCLPSPKAAFEEWLETLDDINERNGDAEEKPGPLVTTPASASTSPESQLAPASPSAT